MMLLVSGMQVLSWFLWFLLLVSMFFLIGVILLQEGKGGGLAEAFGGAGAETFGVKAHGINKFTAIVGGVFLVLCVVLTRIGSTHVAQVMPEAQHNDATPSGGSGAGGGGGGARPPSNSGGTSSGGGSQPSSGSPPNDGSSSGTPSNGGTTPPKGK